MFKKMVLLLLLVLGLSPVLWSQSRPNILICIADDASFPYMGAYGISFLPTLLGDSKKQRKHPYLYWGFPAYGGQQAVRLGKWKGLRMRIKKGNMKIQLFNMKKDIQELHDVSGQHPDIVKKMEQIMEKEHEVLLVGRFKMEALEQ